MNSARANKTTQTNSNNIHDDPEETNQPTNKQQREEKERDITERGEKKKKTRLTQTGGRKAARESGTQSLSLSTSCSFFFGLSYYPLGSIARACSLYTPSPSCSRCLFCEDSIGCIYMCHLFIDHTHTQN